MHIVHAFTVLADLAYDSVSHTQACLHLLTDYIQNYKRENCRNISDTAHFYPNRQIHGKKQNQKRKQPFAGPTMAESEKSNVLQVGSNSKCF